MKTAISLPDDLFRRADQLAHTLGKSRSEVYQEALAEYLARREPGTLTALVDRALDEIAPETDRWAREAAHQALARSEW